MDKLIKFTTNLFLFLLPLYFLPLGGTNADSDKQFLLFFFTTLLLFLTLLKFLIKKKITFVKPSTSLPLLLVLLVLLVLLSTLISSPNKILSLTSPFGPETFLALLLLYIVMIQNINLYKLSLRPLVYGSTISALFYILSSFEFLPRSGILGEPVFALAFFAVVSALLVSQRSDLALRGPTSKGTLIFYLLSFIFLASAGITAYRLITNWPLFLPLNFSWSVMLEMYKNFWTFLFGVGPGNFSYAWTMGKPALVNSTPFWNVIATASSNFPLHLATEAGFIALVVFLLITYKITSHLRGVLASSQRSHLALRGATSIGILSLFLLPPNLLLLILFFILLSFSTSNNLKNLNLPYNKFGRAFLIFDLCTLIFLSGTLYISTRYYIAGINYRLALNAINSGNVQKAYDFSENSVFLNPNSDNYALTASSLNLALSRNFPLTQTATDSASPALSYIQRSVALAKKAMELNPKNSENWAALAQIYQSLIGTAQNSESAALEALNQQIALDPNSPQPRLTAGGLLMSMNFNDRAAELFQQAIALKPDWNNAHYNLAILYSRNQNYQGAMTELERALQLTAPNTPDYKTLSSEITNLQNLMNQMASPAGEMK